MSQENKTCQFCGEHGHSKSYCKKRPHKPIARISAKKKLAPTPMSAPKTRKKKKEKTPSRTQLVKKLDSVFSIWLRKSYADENGMVSCYTCDQMTFWKHIQNGHFFTRGRQNTRWLPLNCRPQDYRCNVALKGNYIIYTRRMLAEIGEQALDDMETLSKSSNKIPTSELIRMIKYYSELGESIKL